MPLAKRSGKPAVEDEQHIGLTGKISEVDSFAAEILQAATYALTHSLNLESVLNTLLNYMAGLVPYTSARVLLLENDASIRVHASLSSPRSKVKYLLGNSIDPAWTSVV